MERFLAPWTLDCIEIFCNKTVPAFEVSLVVKVWSAQVMTMCFVGSSISIPGIGFAYQLLDDIEGNFG